MLSAVDLLNEALERASNPTYPPPAPTQALDLSKLSPSINPSLSSQWTTNMEGTPPNTATEASNASWSPSPQKDETLVTASKTEKRHVDKYSIPGFQQYRPSGSFLEDFQQQTVAFDGMSDISHQQIDLPSFSRPSASTAGEPLTDRASPDDLFSEVDDDEMPDLEQNDQEDTIFEMTGLGLSEQIQIQQPIKGFDENPVEMGQAPSHQNIEEMHDLTATAFYPSPTESQLVAQGFEFHNDLPEEIQISKFNDKAFRKALREAQSDLPRKQQWYAWSKAKEMLNQEPDSAVTEQMDLGWGEPLERLDLQPPKHCLLPDPHPEPCTRLEVPKDEEVNQDRLDLHPLGKLISKVAEEQRERRMSDNVASSKEYQPQRLAPTPPLRRESATAIIIARKLNEMSAKYPWLKQPSEPVQEDELKLTERINTIILPLPPKSPDRAANAAKIVIATKGTELKAKPKDKHESVEQRSEHALRDGHALMAQGVDLSAAVDRRDGSAHGLLPHTINDSAEVDISGSGGYDCQDVISKAKPYMLYKSSSSETQEIDSQNRDSDLRINTNFPEKPGPKSASTSTSSHPVPLRSQPCQSRDALNLERTADLLRPHTNTILRRSASPSPLAISPDRRSPSPWIDHPGINRPDTPRPIPSCHASDIRASVEPETPQSLRVHPRESTPAFEDRSPSPSPASVSGSNSRTTIISSKLHYSKQVSDDVEMLDATPPVPPIPSHLLPYQFHQLSSPDPLSSPFIHAGNTVTAPETPLAPSSCTQSPIRPQLPATSLIANQTTPANIKLPKRSSKPSNTSRRKSLGGQTICSASSTTGATSSSSLSLSSHHHQKRNATAVIGSNITKSRNVTIGVRKATQVTSSLSAAGGGKQKKKEMTTTTKRKSKKSGKVADAVKKIEEMMTTATENNDNKNKKRGDAGKANPKAEADRGHRKIVHDAATITMTSSPGTRRSGRIAAMRIASGGGCF